MWCRWWKISTMLCIIFVFIQYVCSHLDLNVVWNLMPPLRCQISPAACPPRHPALTPHTKQDRRCNYFCSVGLHSQTFCKHVHKVSVRILDMGPTRADRKPESNKCWSVTVMRSQPSPALPPQSWIKCNMKYWACVSAVSVHPQSFINNLIQKRKSVQWHSRVSYCMSLQ